MKKAFDAVIEFLQIKVIGIPLFIILIAAVVLLFVLLIIIILAVKRRRKAKADGIEVQEEYIKNREEHVETKKERREREAAEKHQLEIARQREREEEKWRQREMRIMSGGSVTEDYIEAESLEDKTEEKKVKKVSQRKLERQRKKYKFVSDKPIMDYSETFVLSRGTTDTKPYKVKAVKHHKAKKPKRSKNRPIEVYQDLAQLTTPLNVVQTTRVEQRVTQQTLQQTAYNNYVKEVQKIEEQNIRMQQARRNLLYEQYLDTLDPTRKKKKKK